MRCTVAKVAGIVCLCASYVGADQFIVHAPSGENCIVQIQPHDGLDAILFQVNQQLEFPSDIGDLVFEQLPNQRSAVAKAANKVVRNYWAPATKTEQEIVQHIIITMGNKSLAKIWNERNALKKAGDKLDNLHPFRFLLAIFTNEEAKAAMASLKGRSWVWGEFKKGLYVTLTEEEEKHNLKPEHIEDFAKQLGISSKLIIPALKKCDWDELVTVLIKNVPREGDPTRYNM